MKNNTEKLFGRFRAIYGGRWTACYTTPEAVDLAIAEWAEVIERMNDEQLQIAIAWAKTSCPWPPSIAEFLHAGLEIDDDAIARSLLGLLSSWDRKHMTTRDRMQFLKSKRGIAVSMLVDERLMPALEFHA